MFVRLNFLKRNWIFQYPDCKENSVENSLDFQGDWQGVGGRATLPTMELRLFVFKNEDSTLAFFPNLYQKDDILCQINGLKSETKN